MNTETFKMIIAIVQTGSISGAAQQLGYAQSNISARLHQLEEQLDTKIFYRTPKVLTVTESGKKFYEQAIKIVELTEDTINQIQHPEVVEGNLKIGTLQSASATYLPPILTKYYHKFPKVKLAIETGNPLDNVQQVLNYELDGAVIGENIDEVALTSIPLAIEDLCLISATEKLPDLNHASFLLFTPGCVYREVTLSWLNSKKIQLHHPIEFNYLDAIMASACAGLGISIVPKKIAQPYVDDHLLYMHELPKDFSSIQLSFIYRKDHVINRPFKEFINLLISSSDEELTAIDA